MTQDEIRQRNRRSRRGTRRIRVLVELEVPADVEDQVWNELFEMPEGDDYRALRSHGLRLPGGHSSLSWAVAFGMKELLSMETVPGLEEEALWHNVVPVSDETVE